MLAALLTGLLAYQDPVAEPPKEAAPAAPRPVEVWDDDKAKSVLAEVSKALQGKASMAEKSRALEQLADGSNRLLVKVLAGVIENDKSVVVRKRAAELLANQPARDANAAIRRLLKAPRVDSYPTVMAELLRGLARCDYEPKHWKELDNMFERSYHPERVPMQEAVLDLVIATKERQALPILLRNLDEPIPKNVDDASNPPADYWRARWESWAVWRTKVKEALFAITGQRFSTAADAEAWLKKNPLR